MNITSAYILLKRGYITPWTDLIKHICWNMFLRCVDQTWGFLRFPPGYIHSFWRRIRLCCQKLQNPAGKLEKQWFQKSKTFFGDNSVSLGRIWAKLTGNSSYKPPGASYTAQGPQKQPEIMQRCVFVYSKTKVTQKDMYTPSPGNKKSWW